MTAKPTVLVPLQVLEGESVPNGVPSLLSGARVLILGYHVIPEQTATEQAREQFADRAMERLEDYEAMFAEAGADVDSRLVFTHEAQRTKNRILLEEECTAVLIPKSTPPVENVLVPVRGTVGRDRLVQVIAGLFGGREITVTLFHVQGEAETEASTSELLGNLETALVDAGVEGSQIQSRIESADNPLEAIEMASSDADVVVMGETDPTVATYVFGLPEEQLAEQFLGPVLVVQRPPPETDEASE